MIIDFHKNFKKNLNKLPSEYKDQLYKRIGIFREDLFHPILNNHELHGKLKGLHSINITGDIRAIYEQVDKNTVLFLTIASHSKLYDQFSFKNCMPIDKDLFQNRIHNIDIIKLKNKVNSPS